MTRSTLALIAAVALGGCQQKPEILKVQGVWVRLGATPQSPAAAYFKVYGGDKADRLLRVSSEVNDRTELHESMTNGTMATMRPLAGVDVPAGGKVEFKPGGRHAMLFGMNPAIVPGTPVTLTFTFASGTEIEVDAGTQSASAPVRS